jgi:membrane protease subunit HflK
MAWNEPGGGKRRDPWQDGGGDGPDLEALLRRWRDGLGRLFGGGGGGGGSAGSPSNFSLLLIVVALVAAWSAFDSIQRVDEAERGVVLRFGKFDRVMPAGLNFKWPRPIEEVMVVETTRVRSTSDQVKMLTKDENIINVDFNVQYQVSDPLKFAFGVKNPEDTLHQAAEAAVRQVVGNATMDVILSGERTALAIHAGELLRDSMERYGTGIAVTEFNFQNLRPPPEVKDAFDDAIIAREDKQRIENEAQAYSSKIVPEARGQAARVRAEAEGAKAASVAQANGQAQRYELVADQYKAAPAVTRKRLYLETMQEVLSGTPKVLLDNSGGNKVIYLPLDKLGTGAINLPEAATPDRAAAVVAPTVEATRPRGDKRGAREGRE